MADELGIRVDVDHGDGRDGAGALELGELVKHVVTQPAAFAGDDDEALLHGQGLLALGSQPHGRRGLLGLGSLDLLGEELDGGGRHFTDSRDLMAVHDRGERR